MAHYRKIDVRIWNDSKFVALSPCGKLAFLFVLTHPSLNSMGCMRASIEGLAAELYPEPERVPESLSESLPERVSQRVGGMVPESRVEGFRQLVESGLILVDSRAAFMWVPNFLKYNKPENPNVIRSWDKFRDYLPECHLKSKMVEASRDFAIDWGKSFAAAFETVFPFMRRVERVPESLSESLPERVSQRVGGNQRTLNSELKPSSKETNKEKTLGIFGVHTDGTQPDSGPLRDFMNAWNAQHGTKKLTRMSHATWKLLAERLDDPSWRWTEALKMLPLPYFGNAGMTLDRFIEPQSVDKIINKSSWQNKPEQSNGKHEPKADGAFRPAQSIVADPSITPWRGPGS